MFYYFVSALLGFLLRSLIGSYTSRQYICATICACVMKTRGRSIATRREIGHP